MSSSACKWETAGGRLCVAHPLSDVPRDIQASRHGCGAHESTLPMDAAYAERDHRRESDRRPDRPWWRPPSMPVQRQRQCGCPSPTSGLVGRSSARIVAHLRYCRLSELRRRYRKSRQPPASVDTPAFPPGRPKCILPTGRGPAAGWRKASHPGRRHPQQQNVHPVSGRGKPRRGQRPCPPKG